MAAEPALSERSPASAAPLLALVYAALIVYASLFPFAGWHDQGIAPWSFLRAPWPEFWTRFDLVTNLTGYAPFGFLLVLALTHVRQPWVAAALTGLVALVLSFTMESLQSYLPLRVASNVDLALNVLGAVLGAAVAALLRQRGYVERWLRVRGRWMARKARGVVVLLVLWPVGLLAPTPIAYGMGQVLERLEDGLALLLHDTPFLDLLPLREFELQPLLPATEALCVALGALVPCLLGYAAIRHARQRTVFALLALAAGVGALALSSAMTYGPGTTWAWVTAPVRWGLPAALAAALLLAWLPLPGRAHLALLAAVLVLQLMLLNGASPNVYFAAELQGWEQGRFIHFFGLTQWIAWLWPFAALLYVLGRLLARGEPRPAGFS